MPSASVSWPVGWKNASACACPDLSAPGTVIGLEPRLTSVASGAAFIPAGLNM